ncbi:GMC family oxidoreductase [Mycobacterium sp.]|uniref:GMC family oxidoreductase n=1 Tax=Mycobacterium sp. TaxID=1785 RepID=UPI002D9BADE5|nr:GMC oxidoreductase [Mycobacterium sp.]
MSSSPTADYVIVGSGAGGGPLAVRLAAAGHSVIVIEAGGQTTGLVYDVPVFHAFASESADMSWNFFVSHYDDETQAQSDDKYDAARGGVLYPRAATIGGCTAHNAMITVCPNDSDWDAIADLTGDPSWAAAPMRKYFERLERCTYRRRWIGALLAPLGRLFAVFDLRGHGFDGWLPTSIADPRLVVKDRQLVKAIKAAAEAELSRQQGGPLKAWQKLSRRWFDPNIAAVQKKGSLLGIWLIPLAVGAARRRGTREPLLEMAESPDANLQILTGCFATQLVFDEQKRCTGVEFVTGSHLYRADPHATETTPGPAQVAVATREVIVAGGAFNTPQLLKLSGIGPADELRAAGIDVLVDSPRVGENLQDRYEVTVVTDLPKDLDLLKGRFRPPRPDDSEPDPRLAEWENGRGPYGTNGALLAVVAASEPTLDIPDLFLFTLPADFRGYRVGYAEDLLRKRNRLTWTILKARTNNRAGTVRLRSADPFEPPDIRFRYFEEGSDDSGVDLEAVVAGVKFARSLTDRLTTWGGGQEIWPGPDVTTDDDIRQFVRDNAWGHHACGTCAIGPDDDPPSVIDSKFRVRGVSGLRIVDASVFPRIPGYFIVTAIYMISEKAADVILADVESQAAADLVPVS